MRICIPTVDDRGLEARISEHFGSSPFYTLVDTETGALETLPNGHHGHAAGQSHGQGACRALASIGPHNCDAVICRGMGRGAMASLARAGIDLFLASGEKVSELVASARAGQLQRPAQGQVLCGGHHGHGTSGCGS